MKAMGLAVIWLLLRWSNGWVHTHMPQPWAPWYLLITGVAICVLLALVVLHYTATGCRACNVAIFAVALPLVFLSATFVSAVAKELGIAGWDGALFSSVLKMLVMDALSVLPVIGVTRLLRRIFMALRRR